MISIVIYAMIYLGASLMVYNIHGFVSFGRYVRSLKGWGAGNAMLWIPVALLSFFLLGYLGVAIFGKPDLLVAGILFGGSVFVFIMYRLLFSIVSKVVENERLESKLMAVQAASEEKTAFLSTMSHEMRTPLNIIIGLDNILLKRGDLDAEVRTSLEKIGLAARHLLGDINNILNINDIESGVLRLKHEEFSLEDMIGQVVVIAQSVAEQKGLTFKEQIDENVRGKYLGDEMELKQVLLSLLDNAVKYTDVPGEVSISATICPKSEERREVVFVVSDTGVGMDEEFLSKIFGAFAQEDSSATNRFGGGGGLSLAVAKRIVDEMDGSIRVDSKKGEGSVFTLIVTLDVIEDEEEEPEAVQSEESEEILEGYHILVVEDIEENAEIVMDLLELEGAESEHAGNGRIAVDMFGSSDVGYYDAVLMDLRMPEMDGLEAARRIRALDRSDASVVPIVALTANAFESDVKQTMAAGMNDHLAKPTDADELYQTLKRLIVAASA